MRARFQGENDPAASTKKADGALKPCPVEFHV